MKQFLQTKTAKTGYFGYRSGNNIFRAVCSIYEFKTYCLV